VFEEQDTKEDIFEMQHHHLLRCLEKTTDREFVEVDLPFLGGNGATKKVGPISSAPSPTPSDSANQSLFTNCCGKSNCCRKKRSKATSSAISTPPATHPPSTKTNRPTNGGGKNNSESTMVAIGNPSAMNDINRNNTSNSGAGGGGGDGGFLMNPTQQQQKNSLNTTKINSNGDNLQEVIPVGEHDRHQLYTLNPSQLTSGIDSISDPINYHHLPSYDTTQIPSRTNNTTTQALVNDPTSPTQQQVPITNVIQQNSPSEPDPLYKAKIHKYDKPRVGGIASLADPSVTSPSSGSTIIPMTPTSTMVVNDSANEASDSQHNKLKFTTYNNANIIISDIYLHSRQKELLITFITHDQI
jgi:hypothetical protein